MYVSACELFDDMLSLSRSAGSSKISPLEHVSISIFCPGEDNEGLK